MKFGEYGYTIMSYDPKGYDVDDLVMAAAYDWESYFRKHGFKAVILTERVYEESLQEWLEPGTIVYRIEYDTVFGTHFSGLFPVQYIREDPSYFFDEFLCFIDDPFHINTGVWGDDIDGYIGELCDTTDEGEINRVYAELAAEARKYA